MNTQSKNNSMRLLAIFACFGMLLLQSCSKYNSKPFMKTPATGITKNNVTASAIELSKEDSIHYFNADITAKSGWLTSYPGYQAIQLAIKNNSKNSYIFDTDFINLPIATCHEISEKIYYINYFWVSIEDPDFYTLKDRISKNIEARTLEENTTVVITPYNTLNKFLFIPKDASVSSLSLALTNEQNGEKTVFDVDLE